ncbi:MAG: bifunctional rhamnulose-1-phosphate aldolase/short-chain dehydrogenase, partial [Chloroflexi bacterium]|nr:bifunctional rhamnulose-1-phosphate aldolase/short-chain dehydrogenase [Chloroflexota bacterium]
MTHQVSNPQYFCFSKANSTPSRDGIVIYSTHITGVDTMPQNRWNETDKHQLPALDGLVYRSRLLGSDRTVVNIFGGNTSAKTIEHDHVGREVQVLWVKGSGSDVATIGEGGFAALRMPDIAPLIQRAEMSDEEMVAYLNRSVFLQDRPRQSIETLLHAFIPAPHVDHTHPDAVISLACAADGRALCQRLWGNRMVWVDYIRPGFTLSKQIGEGVANNPQADLVVMGKHGLTVWANTSAECYAQSIKVIGEAEEFINSTRNGRVIFAGAAVPALAAEERTQVWSQVLPVLRGALSQQGSQIVQVDESANVLEFIGSEGAAQFTQVGAACPDHLVHTKRLPLFIDWQPSQGIDALNAAITTQVAEYARAYTAYFEAHKCADDTMMNPYPRITLIPGLGMVTAGADAQAADISNQLYHRAIAVIGGSMAVGEYTSLSAAEAFAIEYWPLEQYKLKLKPAPRELSGKVAVVTGAASGIGRATARRLAADGAHIAIFDINLAGAEAVAKELNDTYKMRRAIAVHCDVTSEAAVIAAMQQVIRAFGGVDIVVNNAGFAIAKPVAETTVDDWDRMLGVLGKGYFLISREAFKIWQTQKTGGSLIVIASKNSVMASKGNVAYSAAKAAELHMARCLAEEGGAIGVRVNTVLPDAVLEG